MSEDIRWKQRFDNYARVLRQLDSAVALAGTRMLSDLEKQGLIRGFEYTHELAWNVLKDYLEFQGHTGLVGSRDSTREAFRRGLLQDGEVWMAMIKSRNTTSHAYDQEVADKIYAQILSEFYPAFQELHASFLPRLVEER